MLIKEKEIINIKHQKWPFLQNGTKSLLPLKAKAKTLKAK
jgi:hypothetical protein